MFIKKILTTAIATSMLFTIPSFSQAGILSKTFKAAVIAGTVAVAIVAYKIYKKLGISATSQEYINYPEKIQYATRDEVFEVFNDIKKINDNPDNPPELETNIHILAGLIDIYQPGQIWPPSIQDGIKKQEPKIQEIIKNNSSKDIKVTTEIPDIQLTEDEKELEKNMLASGIKKPNKGYKPVHLVHPSYSEFETSRDILKKNNIHINDATNGVFLPVIEGIGQEVVAKKIEENKRYAQFVNTELYRQKNKEGVIQTLNKNRQRLQAGNDGFF